VSPEPDEWILRFHAAIDEVARPVAEQNASRLHCALGCSDCCVDELTVFAIEAELITRHHEELLANGEPHPPGACAMLGASGECRIYPHRPYVCRTQGLPLRWLEEDGDEVVEVRDICPKNVEGGPPLEELPPAACWAIGPFEERLAERQANADGGRGERVALRALFKNAAPQRRLPIVR
jgi:Fe-S-cluster containining protein